MPTLADLTTAIDQLLALSAAQQLLQLNSNTCERAYEAYVLALCAEAVRRIPGGTAELVGIVSGLNPPVVVFRGGPGSLSSRNQDFCYIACAIGNKRFEIHVDVEYEGQSGAMHEIDVSVLDAGHATAIRQVFPQRRAPRTNKPLLLAFECKFYTSNPGVALARTFVGLISDCGPNKLNAFVSNRTSLGLDLFLGRTSAPEPFTDLSPLDQESEETFINNVKQVLRKWARGR